MNCEQAKQSCGQVQSLLPAYLDNEVTPSERVLILAHLSGCTVCQQELNLLSTARSQARATLQRRAIQAVPPREAWSRLETRLMEDAQPSSKFVAWFSRKAPGADRASNRFSGGVTMQKRSILSVLAGVLLLAVLAVFVARNAIPVSARQVLDRAYQAQTQTSPTQGIEHIRNAIYTNIDAKSEDQGLNTIVESYSDPVSGNFRVVTTDKESGKVLQVYAFDGSNAYNSDTMQDGRPSESPLTVYHSLQDRTSLMQRKFISVTNRKLSPAQDEESKFMFEKMRQDPQVELLGQETWDNGHIVYVLRSQQEIKLLVENQMTHPLGLVTFYFDVDTYQLLGSRVTMEKDGKEVLISQQQTLIDEILPAESHIAWDLSDLQGINIVDDPNGEHSLPAKNSANVIPVETLAARTDSAYLLKTIPDGFSLEVSILPEQPENEQYFYEASYTNQAGHRFIIRALGKPLEDTSREDEAYTTASGLVLHFLAQPGDSAKDGEFTSAVIEAPNGKTYAIDSTLPRDQVKALAEDLVLVK
jgi:Putative zinc-finger